MNGQRQLFAHPASSNPASPSSNGFPRHDSLSLNGSGHTIALRPGTSLGTRPSEGYGSDDPSAARVNMDAVRSWDDERVSQWLGESNCAAYADLFRKNDIKGNVLFDVDQMALKEMGVRSVGDRVKITVAVKALRQRCLIPARIAPRRPPTPPSDSRPPSYESYTGGANGHGHGHGNGYGDGVRRAGSGRAGGRIPPPLHLPQSNAYPADLPMAWQPLSNTPSSRSLTAPVAPPSSTSPRPLPSSRGPSGSLPPSLPPPRLQPPPPPQHDSPAPSHSSLLSRLLPAAPSISTTAASPTSSFTPTSAWSETASYGLPRAPGPGNLVSAYSRTTSTSPAPGERKLSATLAPSSRPPVGVAPARPSTGTSASASQQFQHRQKQQAPSGRPSTAQAAYGHSQPLSSHPYAAASGSSPTSDAFSTTIYGRNPPPPPPLGTGLKTLLPSPAIGKLPTLSPGSEPSDGSRSAGGGLGSGGGPGGGNSQQQQQQAYGVGNGSFARPTTPGGIVSASGPVAGSNAWDQDGLDAIVRKTIKLQAEDGVFKTVAVADCRDGNEVLGRVLRKFQKTGGGGIVDEGEEDSWGVFTTSSDGNYKLLSPTELFAVCRDGMAPERHGLTVRKTNSKTTASKKSRNLWPFREPSTPDTSRSSGAQSSSPTTPNHLNIEIPMTTIEPASPSATSPSLYGSDKATVGFGRAPALESPSSNERTKMNRASTISIMSSLGVDWPSTPPRDNPKTKSPGASSLLTPARKFFGQRPPSQVIATHPTLFFPHADKKLVRQSMRKSIVPKGQSRDSQYSSSSTSWEKTGPTIAGGGGGGGSEYRDSLSPAAMSRFSGSSHGSNKSAPLPLPPEDPSSPPQRLGRTSNDSTRTPSILEPPDESAEDEPPEPPALARRRLSRLSTASRVSSLGTWAKDSDSASIITVDDVTALLETRRASLATTYSSEEEEPPEGRHLRPPSIALEADDDDDDDEDEDDYSEEESDEEEGIDESPAEAVKPTLKWIKGALIGAGSFGSVYLGMNPMSGSLMAVKQVELPTGNSHNEERKKSMLDALEREIELLKVLQHENIVQYLDSSSDATHLNIFLEYVPGGSVAALLSNYGAFEEALVSKFVRQILTGLDYLHEREIIHRDIKGANILVDNKGGIKISDFGISKKVEDNLLTGAKVHRPSLQGSVYWMAPEVVKQTSYTSKADIWSLGCLVVEMLTGAHPWANLTQMQAIFRIGSSVRPTIPDDISTEADDFLEQTFLIDHNERPSARDLLQHAFIRDLDATSQQTPTRATFSQGNSPVKELAA